MWITQSFIWPSTEATSHALHRCLASPVPSALLVLHCLDGPLSQASSLPFIFTRSITTKLCFDFCHQALLHLSFSNKLSMTPMSFKLSCGLNLVPSRISSEMLVYNSLSSITKIQQEPRSFTYLLVRGEGSWAPWSYLARSFSIP